LLPALLAITSKLMVAVVWMRQNQTATKILVTAFAALSVGLIAAKVAYSFVNSALVTYLFRTETATGATRAQALAQKAAAVASRVMAAGMWLVNAALDANPVVLITAGIIALGVALVIAYKKSETFRNVVGGVIDFVKRHWQLLLALIPGVGPLLVLVARNFKTLRNAAGAVLDFVGDKVQTVIDVFKTLVSWIGTVIDKLNEAFSVAKSVAGAITAGGGPNNYKSPTNVKGGSNVVTTGGPRGVAQVHLYLDGKVFYSAMVNQNKISRRQSGRSLLA